MVYIQGNSDKTRPHHFDAACAMYGTIDMCEDFRLTSFHEVASGKFDTLIRKNLFVGSVEFMREVFNRIGKKPTILNSDRNHIIVPLSYVKEHILNVDGWKGFIKPVEQKRFSGLVVDKYSWSMLNNMPFDLEVQLYEVLPKILSEWRVYVHNRHAVDSKNYGGDFKISPDYDFVFKKMKELADRLPETYVMDVGVCEEKNVIVEFNDMYAIGNYGIDNTTYFSMLKSRYFDIIRGM